MSTSGENAADNNPPKFVAAKATAVAVPLFFWSNHVADRREHAAWRKGPATPFKSCPVIFIRA